MNYKETATIRQGALSILLQTGRFVGIAPLSFKKLQIGYSISVSRYQLSYSFFVITSFKYYSIQEYREILVFIISDVIGLIGIVLNLDDYNKRLVDSQLHSTTLLIVSERMTCILACGIGYMGAIRMKNMIHHINILEKIRTKISYDYNHAKEDKHVMWISFFIIIWNVTLTVLEITFTALRASECDIGLFFYAVHYLQFNILILLKIQIVIISFEVYKVLLELNARLRFMLTLAESDYLTPAKATVINNGVRKLTQCYISVCNVVRKINNDDELYMFLVYICFTFFSVSDGYHLVVALNKPSNTQYRFAYIILQFCWSIMIILRITFFVEPFQRVSDQVAEMNVLLTQLAYHMTPTGNHMSIELDILIKQVILIVPQYCPLGLTTLDRCLITTTFNVIVTFLVFVVQLNTNE